LILPDVNVLVYAHKENVADHQHYLRWLKGILGGVAAYGMSEFVVSAFIRIVTHPRIFDPPSTSAVALKFASEVLNRPHCVRIIPGPRHWGIFTSLVQETKSKGNLIPDAYLAALAIESGCEWITTDRDYSRFPGLKYRHPLVSR